MTLGLALTVICGVISGASVICRAIAPLTKTTADDRAAAWLVKAHKWLSVIALNTPPPAKE